MHALAYFQKAKCLLARANKAEPSTARFESRFYILECVKEHLEQALEGSCCLVRHWIHYFSSADRFDLSSRFQAGRVAKGSDPGSVL